MTEPNAQDVADKAVAKVFSILGVDIDNPRSVEEFREDLRFSRRMRKAADRSMLAFWTAIATAIAAALWAAITGAFKGGGL